MLETPRTGVRFVFTNAADATRLSDFRDWYDTYATSLTTIGELRTADRFENQAAAGTENDPRFLALYDIGSSDPALAWPRTEQSSAYPTSLFEDPRAKLVSPAFRGSFAAVGKQTADREHCRRTGVMIVLSSGGDDTARSEHEKNVMQRGEYYSASRFRLIEGFPEPAEWLEIFETDAVGTPEAPDAIPGAEVRYLGYFEVGA